MTVLRAQGISIFCEAGVVEKEATWRSLTPPGLWIGTLLQGNIHVRQSNLGEHTLHHGAGTLFTAADAVETDHRALTDGPMSAVFVHFDEDSGHSLLGSEAVDLMRSVRARSGDCPQAARAIAWQMLGCTLSGPARNLYMTGKALEMVAHFLIAAQESAKAPAVSPWTPADIERFHAARAVLISRISNPPTVPELAREVGTNARKLNAGFSDLFGQSVYAFAKARRLEEAKLMLEAGQAGIAQVAYRFGYQPAHFSTEFKRRFGVTPTDLIGRRR